MKELSIKDPFWESVVFAWTRVCSGYENTIENEVIWLNNNIRVNKQMIYWKNLINNGLVYVHQLFAEGALKSFNELHDLHRINVMQYNSLATALSKEYMVYLKSYCKGSFLPVKPNVYQNVLRIKNVTAYVYKMLCSMDTRALHQRQTRLESKIGVAFTPLEYVKNLNNMYKVTNINKLRSFQYRLMLDAIVNNCNLFNWKIRDDSLCSFCKIAQETTVHMLVECEKICSLWQDIQQWIMTRFGIHVQISVENVFLNKIASKGPAANFICLMTKQYIYRKRCQDANVNIHELKKMIQNMERVEKYIAICNGKLTKHERKWGMPTPLTPSQ